MSNRNGKFNIKDIVQIIGKTIGSYLGVVSSVLAVFLASLHLFWC